MLCCTYVIRYSLSVRLTPYLFTGVVVTAVRSNGLVATVSAPTAYLCPLGCTRPRPGPTTERGSSRSPTDRQSRHAEQLVVVANGAAQRASVGAKDSLASALNWTRSRPWNTIANHTFLVRGGFHVDGTETRAAHNALVPPLPLAVLPRRICLHIAQPAICGYVTTYHAIYMCNRYDGDMMVDFL